VENATGLQRESKNPKQKSTARESGILFPTAWGKGEEICIFSMCIFFHF
jgi:hypothetical protein